VIPLDSANSRTFNIEAQNNGVGEPWTAEMVATYPRLCAAVLDCINSTTPGAKLGAGDVISHQEWAPTRKIDPAGPSPWCNTDDRYMRWLMDKFRGAVFAQMMAGPPAPLPPIPEPSEEDDEMVTVYLLRGPSGQMYATDRRTFAHRVDDGSMGGYLRDERGFVVGPDTGPWPCSADEESYLARMAG
jgi:hypothetical protein